MMRQPSVKELNTTEAYLMQQCDELITELRATNQLESFKGATFAPDERFDDALRRMRHYVASTVITLGVKSMLTEGQIIGKQGDVNLPSEIIVKGHFEIEEVLAALAVRDVIQEHHSVAFSWTLEGSEFVLIVFINGLVLFTALYGRKMMLNNSEEIWFLEPISEDQAYYETIKALEFCENDMTYQDLIN